MSQGTQDAKKRFLGLHPSEERSLCQEVLRYLICSDRVMRLLRRRENVGGAVRDEDDGRGE